MVHIYCGNGKGKTTAALGLAIRMAGTGGSVHLYQFMKGNPSSELASLEKLGIKLRRYKTGTPARVDKRSVDFSKMQEQKGDEKITPFSFENKREDIDREQFSCFLTYTNEKTHEIIKANLDRSPLYSGEIKGIGPQELVDAARENTLRLFGIDKI